MPALRPSLSHLAYVVSPHGFGHAARSSAVIEALRLVRPGVVPHIYSTVPSWFWKDSLRGDYEEHRVLTDVGLVQLSPIEEDAPATLEALTALRPFSKAAEPLARSLVENRCELVVCDISPLGLAAARLAGLPAALIESFTWDWIYEPYFEAAPGLRSAADEMAALFAGADLRIQTEPVCRGAEGAERVSPIYREPRSSPTEVRRRLELDDARPIALVTMGGTPWSFAFLERLHELSDVFFVAFAGTERAERRENVLLLPERSPVYVPDLIAASDVVIGKLGYSTVAEAWGSGVRYVYVPRPSFPEGPFLAEFVSRHLPSLELDASGFQSGSWLTELPRLLREPRPEPGSRNGAEHAASLLADMMESTGAGSTWQ